MKLICNKCKIEKELNNFYKDSSRKDGFRKICKSCILNNCAIYYKNNKEKKKIYAEVNSEKLITYRKKYYQLNKEDIKKTNQLYREKNRELARKRVRDYYNKNKKEINKKNTKRKRERSEYDYIYKLERNLRNRLYCVIKREHKYSSVTKLLGCSIDQLKGHLEKQFKEGMDWTNYGRKGWHIDHILPCSYFNLEKLSEQKKCFHFSNLQPLWEFDNLSKGNKIINKK